MSEKEFDVTTILMKSEQLNDLCRLCGSTEDQLMPIFSGDGLENKIKNKIQRYLPFLEVNEDDNLPLNVCYQCASSLISWDKLYEGCKIADCRLRKLFGEEFIFKREASCESERCHYLDEDSNYSVVQLSPLPGDVVKCEINNSDLEDDIQEIITDVIIETDTDVLTGVNDDDGYSNIRCRTIEEIITREDKFSEVKRNIRMNNINEDVISNDKTEIVSDDGENISWTCRFCEVSFDDYRRYLRHEKRGCRLRNEPEPSKSDELLSSEEFNFTGKRRDDNKKTTVDVSSLKCKEEEPSNSNENNNNNYNRKKRSSYKNGRGENDEETCLCYYCERKFRSKHRLERHMIVVHIKRNDYCSRYLRGYCCEICSRGFLRTADLFVHRLSVHNLPEMPWSKYMRTVCLLVFCVGCRQYYRKSSVSSHRCENINNNNNNNNNDNNNDNSNNNDDDNNKPYFCDICGIRYRWKCILRLHRENVHNEMWSNRFLNVTNPKYVCELCDRGFNDDHLYGDHDCTPVEPDEQYKYCLVKRYACSLCEKYFPFRKDIYRHVLNVHPEAGDRLINDDKVLFGKKIDINDISNNNNNNNNNNNVIANRNRRDRPFPFRCSECDYYTYVRKDLLEHLKIVHDLTTDTPFYCHVCRRSFKRPQSFLNHMQSTHPPNETEEQRTAVLCKSEIIINGEIAYHCDICNRNVFKASDFLVHYRAHHVEKKFTCDRCGRQMRSRYYLNRHVNIVHLNVREFVCDLCGKTFNRKQSQIEHRRIHTGERPYACETCGKTFVAMNSLISHRKFHNDYYPYECRYCGKKFKIRRATENHERTHTGERPYKCDICPKTFNNSSRYSYHKKVTHSNNRPYRCYICASSFKTMKFLRRHINLHSVQHYIQVRKRNNPYLFNKLHSADGKLLCPSNRKTKKRKPDDNNRYVVSRRQNDNNEYDQWIAVNNNINNSNDNSNNNNNYDSITEEIVYSDNMIEYDPDEEKYDDPPDEHVRRQQREEYTTASIFTDYMLNNDEEIKVELMDGNDYNNAFIKSTDDVYDTGATTSNTSNSVNNGIDTFNSVNSDNIQDAIQFVSGNFTYEDVGPDELIEIVEQAEDDYY